MKTDLISVTIDDGKYTIGEIVKYTPCGGCGADKFKEVNADAK